MSDNVIVLPTLGGTSTSAVDINDAGQVVGSSMTAAGRSHAFLWTPAGGMQDLGTLGGPTSSALAINDGGEVVGVSEAAEGRDPFHAFLWTSGEGMRDLGTLGTKWSTAFGINDNGQVVGSSVMPLLFSRAFMWTARHGMQDLGSLGAGWTQAWAINEAGQVVGYSLVADGEFRAFLWTAGQGMRDLGALDGESTAASAINDAGDVVGYTWPQSPQRAFLWLPREGMRSLGTLGGASSAANGINNAGQVVGNSATAGGIVHAFIWTARDGMEDLYPLTGMTDARAINNRGQVVGDDRVATIRVQSPNRSPSANVGGPYAGVEGSSLTLALSGTDEDGDALSYSWDLGDGTVGSGNAPPATHVYADDGAYSVRLTVTDGKGGSDTKTTTATIANVAPAIHSGGLTGPTVPVELTAGAASAPIAVTFTDPAGERDTYAAEIQCGNGTTLSLAAITSPFTATCTYSSAGVYTVRATVSDEDGGTSAAAYYRYVVVFDREGGFATGSGFFALPGPAKAKAHFSFSVKFLPGQSRPNGNAKFWDPESRVDFVSTAIDMLVVSGERAQFWGTGLLNGAAASFRITAVDAQSTRQGTGLADAFRVELWRGATLVFDTQPGTARDAVVTTPVEGGSIQIHPD